MKSFILITGGAGLALTVGGWLALNAGDQRVRHDRNPFALHESAYGKLLAELSQDTVDVVWHLGIEQINPIGHHDHDHGHGHDDHDHDHGHGHDDHDHDHGHGHGHDDHDHGHADHGDHHSHDSDESPFSEETRQALVDAGINPEHLHCPDCAAATLSTWDPATREHLFEIAPELKAHIESREATEPESGAVASHDHDHDHHGPASKVDVEDDHHHDHEDDDHEHASIGIAGAIAAAKDFLSDLKAARYDRTNPYAVTEAHKLHISGEIEQMLLRSYKMDPTNYGVYNAYYLFLTAHEFRADGLAIDHARKISRHTIARAHAEDTAPGPWLTAEMALLNLFFLDWEDWREAGIEPPVEKLREYRDHSAYCKQQYEILKERAIRDGRWETVSEEKRDEMAERQRFASKTFEQFDVLIARYSRQTPGLPGLPGLSDLLAPPAGGDSPSGPVATSTGSEEDEEGD